MGFDGLPDDVVIRGILAIVHCDLSSFRQPLPEKRDHAIYAASSIIRPCEFALKSRASGGHPWHLSGLHGPDFQLAENYCIRLLTTPWLQSLVNLLGFHPKPSTTQIGRFV
jgi:hypothetical protein